MAENTSSQHSVALMISVVIAIVIAVVALILSTVALNQSGTSNISILSPSSSRQSALGPGDDDQIWLLAIEETGFNYAYIDDASGELRGFSIDMANAVCRIANKKCEIVYDSYRRCWDATPGTRAQGGKGLFGGYYDGCVGPVHSYDRPRTFRFSDPYADNVPAAVLLTLPGNPGDFKWQNLTGSRIGFIDGFVLDEHCLARTDFIAGNKLSSNQIVHYPTRGAAHQGLKENEVDAIFDAKRIYLRNPQFQIESDDFLTCVKAGFSVMTRKDNQLIDWWNPAFATLSATSEWTAICNDLLDKHGHVGGGDPSSCVGID